MNQLPLHSILVTPILKLIQCLDVRNNRHQPDLGVLNSFFFCFVFFALETYLHVLVRFQLLWIKK